MGLKKASHRGKKKKEKKRGLTEASCKAGACGRKAAGKNAFSTTPERQKSSGQRSKQMVGARLSQDTGLNLDEM